VGKQLPLGSGGLHRCECKQTGLIFFFGSPFDELRLAERIPEAFWALIIKRKNKSMEAAGSRIFNISDYPSSVKLPVMS